MKKLLSLMLVLAMVMTSSGMATLASASNDFDYNKEDGQETYASKENAKEETELGETEAKEEDLEEETEIETETETEVEAEAETEVEAEAETEVEAEVEVETEIEAETEVETETETEVETKSETETETEETEVEVVETTVFETTSEEEVGEATPSELSVIDEASEEQVEMETKVSSVYIKDVKMLVANKEEAEKRFEENGYIMLPTNLNNKTAGKEIYLGYSTTDNEEEAIRAIGERWFNDTGRNPESYRGSYHQYDFTAVTDFNGKQWNTNEGGYSYARWVYLYTSKDKEAGKPVAVIEVISQSEEATKEELSEDNVWTVVTNSNDNSLSDFNRARWMTGEHIYIRYSSEKIAKEELVDEFNRSKRIDLDKVYSGYKDIFSLDKNTIKLEKDIQLTKRLNIKDMSVILDLNGHVMTGSSDDYAIYLDNSTFTLIDSSFVKDEVRENTGYEDMYKGKIIGKYDESVIYMKDSDVVLNQGYVNKSVNNDPQNSVLLVEKSNLTVDGAIIKGSNGNSRFNQIGEDGGMAIKVIDAKQDNVIKFESGLVYGGNGGKGSNSNVEAGGGYGFKFGRAIMAIDKLGYNYGMGIVGGYGGGYGGDALYISEEVKAMPTVDIKENFSIIGGDGGKGQTKLAVKNGLKPSLSFKEINGVEVEGEIKDEELPTKYDAREEGIVTSLKCQEDIGWCWNFANCSVAETNMLKHYKDYTDKYLNKDTGEFDLSEEAQGYFIIHNQKDPLGNAGESYTKFECEGIDNNGMPYKKYYEFYSDELAPRDSEHIFNYQSAFRGHIMEEKLPFLGPKAEQEKQLKKIAQEYNLPFGRINEDVGARKNNVTQLKQGKIVYPGTGNNHTGCLDLEIIKEGDKYSYIGRDEFVKQVKKDILKYGSLSMSVNWRASYFNGKEYGMVIPQLDKYCGREEIETLKEHGISIIGWDDNFYPLGFEPVDDAWRSDDEENEDDNSQLIKWYKEQFSKFNNKGAFLCKNSNVGGKYVWVSYDMPFRYTAFEYVPADKYNDVYYYDGGIGISYDLVENMDVEFSIQKEDTAQGISIIVDSNVVDVNYKLIINDEEIVSEPVDLHRGLNFIDLSTKNIRVNKNDKVKIEFCSQNMLRFGLDESFRAEVTTIHKLNESKGYNPRIKLITGDNVTVKFDSNGLNLDLDKDTYTISKYEKIKIPTVEDSYSFKIDGWYDKDTGEMVDDNTRFTKDTILYPKLEYIGKPELTISTNLLFRKLGDVIYSIKKINFTDVAPKSGTKYDIEDGFTAYVDNDTVTYVIAGYRKLVLPKDSLYLLAALCNYEVQGFEKIDASKTNTMASIQYVFKEGARWVDGYRPKAWKDISDELILDPNNIKIKNNYGFLGFNVEATLNGKIIKDYGYVEKIDKLEPYLRYIVTVDVAPYITPELLFNKLGIDKKNITKITFTENLPLKGVVKDSNEQFKTYVDGSEVTYYFKRKLKISEDSSNLFAGLSNVTSIMGLSCLDFTDVKNLSGLFKDDPKLVTIDFGNVDLSKVTDISKMFSGDTKLSTLTGFRKDTLTDTVIKGDVLKGVNNLALIKNNRVLLSDTESIVELDLSGGNYSGPTYFIKDETEYILPDVARSGYVHTAWECNINGKNYTALHKDYHEDVKFTALWTKVYSNNDINYISDIKASYGSNAKKDLESQGYKVVNANLNDYAFRNEKGKNILAPEIYIGYKTTTNRANAITNIVADARGKSSNSSTINYDNVRYYAVTDGQGPLDMNKGAGGDYIYLYYTRDSKYEPITGLAIGNIYDPGSGSFYGYDNSYFSFSEVKCSANPDLNDYKTWKYSRAVIDKDDDRYEVDMNKGCKGDKIEHHRIYMMMQTETVVKDYISSMNNNSVSQYNKNENIVLGTAKGGAYIKDIKMVVAKKESAKEIFNENGYVMLNESLNAGTTGKEIYIGYTTTDDKSEAITAIGERWFNSSTNKPETYKGTYHKNDYVAVKDFKNGMHNTNEGGNNSARWVYLYTSKDSNAGDPVRTIEIMSQENASTIEELSSNNKYVIVTNSNDGGLSDFNRSNSLNVNHIYIRYTK